MKIFALGWCWQPMGVLHKYVTFSRRMEEAGIECVWVCTVQETKYALLAHGILAHAVEDFLPLQGVLCRRSRTVLSDADVVAVNRVNHASGVKLLPLRTPADRYERLQAEFCTALWELLVAWYRPKIIINLNGLHCIAVTLSRVAEACRIPVYYLENGLVPETLVLDEVGVNGGAHMAGSRWAHIPKPELLPNQRQAIRDYRVRLVASATTLLNRGKLMSAEDVRQRLGLSERQRILLMPLQVDNDTNIVCYSPMITSMQQLVEYAVGLFAPLEDWVIVAKEHPKRAPQGDPGIACLCGPRLKYVHDIQVTSLLHAASAVLCINSTVGLEALLRGLPVISLGRSTYSEKGFTLDAFVEPVTPEALQLFLSRPFPEESFDQFLAYLFMNHLFPLSDALPFADRCSERIERMLCRAADAPNCAHIEAPVTKALRRVLDEAAETRAAFKRLRSGMGAIVRVRGKVAEARWNGLCRHIQMGLPDASVECDAGWRRRLARIVRRPDIVLTLRPHKAEMFGVEPLGYR